MRDYAYKSHLMTTTERDVKSSDLRPKKEKKTKERKKLESVGG